MSDKPHIAIVGGGCSGTLVAAQLARQGFAGRITVIEPRPKLGRGLAYSTVCPQHVLNVPAGKMSAFPDCPSHFLDWLHTTSDGETMAAGSFVPRQRYGEYLDHLLRDLLSSAANRAELIHARAEALALEPQPDGWKVQLDDGTATEAHRVVLALGNPASSALPRMQRNGAQDHVHSSPWLGGALQPASAGERVLLLGTGLTAVDSLLALMGQDSTAPATVYMVSRRGMLPQVHAPSAAPAGLHPVWDSDSKPPTLRQLVSLVRGQVKAMHQREVCWRPVIDTLRPISNQLWENLTQADRSRFLRHVKTYWEPHRHRMAPQVLARVDELRRAGKVEVLAGRVKGLSRVGDCIHVEIASRDAALSRIKVDRVINCTGLHEDYEHSPRKLIATLIATGLATPDPLRTGFHTDPHGALLDSGRNVSPSLFTLGPPRRGGLFETTAVPEIRAQAEKLASHLIALDNMVLT